MNPLSLNKQKLREEEKLILKQIKDKLDSEEIKYLTSKKLNLISIVDQNAKLIQKESDLIRSLETQLFRRKRDLKYYLKQSELYNFEVNKIDLKLKFDYKKENVVDKRYLKHKSKAKFLFKVPTKEYLDYL